MIEKEFPVFKTKRDTISNILREELIKTLDEWNMILGEGKIFSAIRDVIFTQQYKFIDKIEEASCKLIYDKEGIFVNYEIVYFSIEDKLKEFEVIEKCNTLFRQGKENFTNAYKRMCRRDKTFIEYDFQYIYIIARTKNPIQVEKTDQENTLRITYKIDL